MATTNYQYLEPSGVIVPDTSAILAGVQSEFQAAFGTDLVVTPDTPQGLLITAETLSRTAVVKNNAALANQINPNIAGGVFLDALLALTGVQRTPQTQTLVANVTVTGVASTIIPQGSQAATAAQDVFITAGAVTIPNSGTTQVNFYSQQYGPIPCAADALNTIVSGVIGWETVDNNPSSTPASTTTLGQTTQSDQAARAFRQNTLAYNGLSLPEAITSALYATAGVTSLTFQENIAATTQTINGISMVAHSVYACVEGGTDTDVAAVLLENKSSGSAWNGNTSVSVVEPASGQTYTVLFDRPSTVGIVVKVYTTNGNAANIQQAILDYAAGLIPNMPGFVVGASVSAFDIAAAILAENPSYYISNVEIGNSASGPPPVYATTPVAIAVNEIAQTQLSYITVIIA